VFALPTQATANAMLLRTEDFAKQAYGTVNVVLAHGKRQFNEGFKKLVERGNRLTAQGKEEAAAQCAAWLASSRKRVFLGQIGVCTVDQVLLSVLPVRHKFVRGFGLAKSVLIVDEVQHAITTEDGRRMLEALKAARDAINPRPDTRGHFIMIGTGSHRAMVAELTTRRSHAFEGATSMAYPVLGRDYVEHLLHRIAAESPEVWLPSLETAVTAFETVGHRPEEMRKALRAMFQASVGTQQSPDAVLPIVARTLRLEAAEIEFRKIEDMGVLAALLFDRIASAVDEGKKLFGAEALQRYAQGLGREVATDEVQRVLNDLLAENLVMRSERGRYVVTDPFVQSAWMERKLLESGPWSMA